MDMAGIGEITIHVPWEPVKPGPVGEYIEVIDIHGMDPFVADVSDPEFQKVAAAFGEFTDNPTFILTEDL